MDKRKVVSKLLKYSGVLKGLRVFSGNEKLRILMYHRVFDKGNDFCHFLDGVPPAKFEKQMQFLSENFSVIALEEAVERIKSDKALPKRAVAITIDDGYRDCYDNIYPVLKKYDLPATVYLTTNNVGSSNAFWADKVGYLFKKGRPSDKFYEHDLFESVEVGSPEKRSSGLSYTVQKLKSLAEIDKNMIIEDLKDFFQVKDHELKAGYNLTWDQIREMSRNGVFFGAHTVTHPIMTRISAETAEAEIIESKNKIEVETGRRISGFCYPNGTEADFNEQIIGALKKHEFKYAITTLWGFNDADTDLFMLKRVGPNCDDDIDRFECIISGGFEVANSIRSIIRMKK